MLGDIVGVYSVWLDDKGDVNIPTFRLLLALRECYFLKRFCEYVAIAGDTAY